MKLTVDPDVDALYLRLTDSKIIDSEEVSPGIVLDYDEKDEVVGVEILHLSKRGADVDELDYRTLRSRQPEEAVVRETAPPYGTKTS